MFGALGRRAGMAILPLAVCLALTFGLVGATPAGAVTLRHRMLRLINDARRYEGLRPLRLNTALSNDATAHTRAMVHRNAVYHDWSVPSLLAPYNWRIWGENVGCADSAWALHRAFMRSPTHRANLLRPAFRQVGLGVIRTRDGNACGGGYNVWATEIFFG